MSKWLTPEEIHIRKERKKKILYISMPIMAAAIGAIVTVLASSI
ncbi:hypothetical protein [Alkalihalobacillus sp. BA299]|nr:hypothetical protein [Alkalihalobacillus sp. BA299]